jgi:FG-GAP-like repeat/FG-GAP repeat
MGRGRFPPKRDYAAGRGPEGLAVGDVNGDRRPDVVTANSTGNTVSVLLDTRAGTLRKKRDYAAGAGSVAVAIADLNRDGKPDLVTANFDADTVSVLLGAGSGRFRSKREYETGSGPIDIAVGDVNRDRRPDVVTADAGQIAVSLLLGAGGRGRPPAGPAVLFPHGRPYWTVSSPESIALGDLNRDGRPDIATAGGNAKGIVSVLLNKGDGRFRLRGNYITLRHPHWLAVADLNGDGSSDVVTASGTKREGFGLSLLLNRGDGTFRPRRDVHLPQVPSFVAAGDLDGDGSSDLVAANGSGYRVFVLLNRGGGAFGPARAYRTGREPGMVAIGDLNGDGKADLATANLFPGTVSVLLNGGGGTFQPRHDYPIGKLPRSIAAGDLNGDGRPDLAVTLDRPPKGSGHISVLLNRGDGSFDAAHAYRAGPLPESVVIGDLDGDGRPDLATGGGFETDSLCVLFNKGEGSFRPALCDFATPGVPSLLAVGDLNGDRRLDLVTTITNGSIAVHLNRGGR